MLSFISYPYQAVHRWLDRAGMYRVVTLTLGTLVLVALVYGGLGIIPYTPLEQGIALLVALGVSCGINVVLAHLWRISANHESAVITALIVHFLVIPPQLTQYADMWLVAAVSALAMVSKYVVAWRGQHLLNPAAAGAVALALVYVIAGWLDGTLSPRFFETVWWLGTASLFVPVLFLGSLVVTKIRKWPMVLAFLGVGFATFVFEDWRFGADVLTSYERYWLAGPSIFLAFFMLTEPFTTPPTTRLQLGYGALVGLLANTALFAQAPEFTGLLAPVSNVIPAFKMTPELALVIGNVLFWPATLRRKLILPLASVRHIADQTYEFIFTKPAGLRFQPGQYLEWMLPHAQPDSRGVRRYFTIASSPTEGVIRLALRTVPNGGSTYKQKLMTLKTGDTIVASQLAGDFLLPTDPTVKLGFIAGGIGITPFRSHIQYMADTGSAHDTVLFYCNNTRADIVYVDEFAAAATMIPLSVVHVIAKETVAEPFETGFIDVAMLERRAPDYLERTWYLSGPPGMVHAYASMLEKAGVSTSHIIKDLFPGLA